MKIGILSRKPPLYSTRRLRQAAESVIDAFGRDPHPVKARKDGIVLGRRVDPLVHQGEGLVHLGDL